MNVLLDTHVALWFAFGDTRLPEPMRAVISDADTEVFVSEISLLEVVIKHMKNPGAFPLSGEDFLTLCEDGDFSIRPITRDAILAYQTLDIAGVGDKHKDPFDRLLIAQAKAESLTLLTCDASLDLYNESCIASNGRIRKP